MTIPTRPAPAPPQMRNFNSSNGSAAAADANASLEQLRSQLQQQQQQQKITIKLPPPPKGVANNSSSTTFPLKSNYNSNNNNNNYNQNFDSGTSSITRKFPKARYAPTTNWNDSPFEANNVTTVSATANGNASKKKVPPPRPPPPKVLVNGRPKTVQQSSSSSNILTNIFHRKKTTTTTTTTSSNKAKLAKQNSAARVYGLSTGNYASTAQISTISTTSNAGLDNTDWNAVWNTTTTTNNSNNYTYSSTSASFSTTTTTSQNQQESQLISFDSPPSSPTFTQKSNSDCVSVDSFSSDSNFSSPQNGSVSQPESGFEDDFSATRSRPATTSPLDPWETFDAFGNNVHGSTTGNGYGFSLAENSYCSTAAIVTAPVRNLNMRSSVTTSNYDNPLCNGKSLLPPAPSINMPTIIKPKISQKPKAPKPPAFGIIKQQDNSSVLDSDLPTPPSPPMPQCAPPPPPTILDVITGKVDAMQLAGATNYDANSTDKNSQPYGIALYNFDGTEEGDLCFREGEKIYLLEQASADWYRGRTRAGCEGLLPANYIDVKVPLSKPNKTPSSPFTSQSVLPKVRCLYDFPAEVEGDLALKENDVVTILYRINEDWLFGEINNRQGQFPANFLEYIPNNI